MMFHESDALNIDSSTFNVEEFKVPLYGKKGRNSKILFFTYLLVKVICLDLDLIVY
jgi:hypothetical protein